MKFDIIIANPPYGRIGNEITQGIVDNLEWEVYVNLMPANDYRRFNKGSKLYQFVDIRSMTPVIDGFSDAAVTTHIALINKERSVYLSEAEFEIENYTDKSLKKYFYENRKREHRPIDSTNLSGATDTQFKNFNIDTTVVFGSRDVNHGHLPYSKDCDTYKYNVLRSISNEELFNNRKAMRNGVYDGWLHIAGIIFESKVEKDNCVAFMYSDLGFKFLSKLFVSVCIDGTINLGKVFPKVSWTKQQTVQSILKDYGYTSTEIQEVIDDLKNFKGMDNE